MPIFTSFDRHARLVERMADTLGVHLAQAALTGRLAPCDLHQAVMRCMRCSNADACLAWLDMRSGDAELTPDYCRNKGRFERRARR